MREEPMSFDILFQNAVALHEAGRLDEAENAYRRLLETAPDHADLLHLIGMIATQKGASESAVPYLYKAVKLMPDAVPYRFTLACALQSAGHLNEALENYKEILKRDPSLPDTYNNMGNIYLQKGDAIEAELHFQKALEKNPSYAPAFVNLGAMKRKAGDFDAAADFFDKAIASAPDMADGYAQKALLLREKKDYAGALALYDKALAIEPENVVVLNGRGVALEAADRLDEALACYDKVIALAPRFADAYNNRANVRVRLNRKWDAEDDFKKAVKIDPDYAQAYNNLGALLFSEERYEEALECYRKAFLINKNQPEAMNNLAMAVKAAGDLQEAVALLFNALVAAPDLQAVQNNLAAALYELYAHENQKKDAVALVEKWVKKYPDHAVARHLLASLTGKADKEQDAAFVTGLFDAFADSFDGTLEAVDYRVPDMMRDAFARKFGGKKARSVLDAGCGTGLCGVKIRPFAEILTGVDLSAKMLARAKEKGVYDDLQAADAVAYMNGHSAAFDAVCLGDVACYFPDLAPVLAAAFATLKDGGALFMTVEAASCEKESVLNPTGRYAHNAELLQKKTQAAGFKVDEPSRAVLRKEDGKDVDGAFFVAEKQDNAGQKAL